MSTSIRLIDMRRAFAVLATSLLLPAAVLSQGGTSVFGPGWLGVTSPDGALRAYSKLASGMLQVGSHHRGPWGQIETTGDIGCDALHVSDAGRIVVSYTSSLRGSCLALLETQPAGAPRLIRRRELDGMTAAALVMDDARDVLVFLDPARDRVGFLRGDVTGSPRFMAIPRSMRGRGELVLLPHPAGVASLGRRVGLPSFLLQESAPGQMAWVPHDPNRHETRSWIRPADVVMDPRGAVSVQASHAGSVYLVGEATGRTAFVGRIEEGDRGAFVELPVPVAVVGAAEEFRLRLRPDDGGALVDARRPLRCVYRLGDGFSTMPDGHVRIDVSSQLAFVGSRATGVRARADRGIGEVQWIAAVAVVAQLGDANIAEQHGRRFLVADRVTWQRSRWASESGSAFVLGLPLVNEHHVAGAILRIQLHAVGSDGTSSSDIVGIPILAGRAVRAGEQELCSLYAREGALQWAGGGLQDPQGAVRSVMRRYR